MSLKKIGSTLKAIGKVLVGSVGFILAVLNEALPIVPEQHKALVTAVIGVLTLVSTYYAPYKPLPLKSGSAAKPAARKPRSRRAKKAAAAAHADHVTVNPVTGETGEIPKLEAESLQRPGRHAADEIPPDAGFNPRAD